MKKPWERIEGSWRLTADHELQYRRAGARKEIVLSGPITRAEPLGLSFRVAETSVDGDVVGREMTLRGSWQADDSNRLNFLVERQESRQNRLTLQGAWELGPSQEILYRWQVEDPRKRRTESRLLRFQGYWDVGEDKRLTYVLDAVSGSLFRFRGAFQTPTVLAKEGRIRYQIGVEAEGKKRLQTVMLFGKWKISRNLALEFEVPYRGGVSRAITFGAAYALTRQQTLSARLTTRQGKPLGVELTFTREFRKGQGEAFLRLRRSIEESVVEGGVRFRW